MGENQNISRITLRFFQRVFWMLAITLSIASARLHSAEVAPPKPDNHLLDQGSVFPAEVKDRLVNDLLACARDYDVHIYVMTVPTLKVMPSRAGEKLNELLLAARTDWLKGKVGAIIVFDDEAGRAAMGESEEARNVFSALELNRVMNDPKLQSKKKRSGPERLAATVSLLIQHFTAMRTQANEAARKQRMMNLVFGAIAGGLALIGLGVAIVKIRSKRHAKRRRHSARHHV